MGDADAAVDGEGGGQVLVEFAEPGPVDFVDQLGHPDDLWGHGGVRGGGLGPPPTARGCQRVLGDGAVPRGWAWGRRDALGMGLCPGFGDRTVSLFWGQDRVRVLGTGLCPGFGDRIVLVC